MHHTAPFLGILVKCVCGKKCIWKEKVIISFTSVVSIELYAGLISVGAFPKLESYLSHYYLFYPLCPESCLSHYYPISPLHPNQPSLCFEESAPFVFYPRHVVSDKSPKWFDTRNTISGHFRVLLIRKKTWFFDGLQNQVFSVVFFFIFVFDGIPSGRKVYRAKTEGMH